MNTIKSVYDRLFKEETQLSSYNVELGLIDELKSKYKFLQSLNQKAINVSEDLDVKQRVITNSFNNKKNASLNLEDITKKLDDISVEFKRIQQEQQTSINNLDKANKSFNDDYNLFIKTMNNYESIINELKSNYKSVSKSFLESQTKAKELGIDLPKEILGMGPELGLSEDLINDNQGYLQEAKSIKEKYK